MDKMEVSSEWIKFAKEDLESAKFLLNKYPNPLEIICYHCQQSGEKYLKGYLIYNGEKNERTHDLVLLRNKCETFDETFKEIKDDCLELLDYAVVVRYPYEKQITDQNMREAIKSAERIESFVSLRFKDIKDKEN